MAEQQSALQKLQNRLAPITDSWWWLLLRGVLIVLFGLYGLLALGQQLLLVLRVLALFSALDAVSDCIIVLRRHTERTQWIFIGLRALLGVVTVVIAFAPYDVRVLLPLLAVAFFIVPMLDFAIVWRVPLGSRANRRSLFIGAGLHLAFGILLLVINANLGIDQTGIYQFVTTASAINILIILIGAVVIAWALRQRSRGQAGDDGDESPPTAPASTEAG